MRKGRVGLSLIMIAGLTLAGIAALGSTPPSQDVDVRTAAGKSPAGPTRRPSVRTVPSPTSAPASSTSTAPKPTATTTTSTSTTTTTTSPAGSGTLGLFDTPAISSYMTAESPVSDVNAAVYNLTDGQLSIYKPTTLEDTASIVKVDILATLLHQEGSLDSDDVEEATTMIENSNDDAASDLWDEIGENAGLGKFDALIPMSSTVPGQDGYWGLTTTTGADQISLLRQLVQPSRLLTAAQQQYELGLMENVEADQRWGVSAGVPSGTTIALKNGWLPLEADGDWQINSIGWIDGDGHDYLIAVLTNGNPTEYAGIKVIEGLSQLVWAATG